MKEFNIEIKDNRDGKWYSVDTVSFRFWKNHPSDGINEIRVLSEDCSVPLESIHIEDIKFTVW